ncbi:MAG: alpha/beta hydrolase [Nocardioides alkalitolerans]
MTTTIRTSDGVHLHHTDTGPASAPDGLTMVLVAGYMASAETWALQVDALVAAGHRAISLDRRNHGRSDFPEHGQRMGRHGQDLHEALEQLDVTDVVLVGGSQGASTIWAYLDLHGDSRVRGVVSVDQTPRMLNGDGWDLGFYGYDRSNAATYFAESIPATGRGAGPERTFATLQVLAARLGGDPTEAIGRLMPGLHPVTLPLLQDHALADWRDVVARTGVPVLAVAGADSQYWPAEHAGAIASLAPRGRALVLDDCGHAANFDQPDAFNAGLLAFLAELA